MLKKLFKRNLLKKQYQPFIQEINEWEQELKVLNDSDFQRASWQFQRQSHSESDLTNLIGRAFAFTREASVRTLGLRHFDVQLLGGIVLHNQQIAEMKTGEGKTLVATLPAFLNGISKKGVHLVTVNEYLATRDQISMGQIYRFLGLDTGLVLDSMSPTDKQASYQADITYVTNYEVTFDYLRDNMVDRAQDLVLRPFHYCLLDEVDSILIDEAQTPLILSEPVATKVDKYIIASEIADYLQVKVDYQVDQKNKNITLTEAGSQKVETLLKLQSLYDPTDPWISFIKNAVKAVVLYFRNVHYIVQNERIVIVDEFTGRLMPDRRWSEGLHAAIEAKEGVPIRQNTETVAAITYQNFFLLYPKLAGMTGTGKTAELEFEKIYNLSVEEIPTAKPTQRKDLPDVVYRDQFSKWTAIAETCQKIASTGQPILIGTKTIEKSELLAQLLSEYQLSYQLLNAKPENIRQEAEIVAEAGKSQSITIATNLAGRGTDIILGGNRSFQNYKRVYEMVTRAKNSVTSQSGLASLVLSRLDGISQTGLSVLRSVLDDSSFLALSDLEISDLLLNNDQIAVPGLSYQYSLRFLLQEEQSYWKKHQSQDSQLVRKLGGLYILGTERNDSRRIDNQLRGRSGRQGDPGTSRFFLSLDDTLFRLFGGSRIQTLLQRQLETGVPLESRLLTRSLNAAQTKVEELAYQGRKNLFEYDAILNQQRTVIYAERNYFLTSPSVHPKLITCLEQTILEISLACYTEEADRTPWSSLLENLWGKKLLLFQAWEEGDLDWSTLTLEELQLYLFSELWLAYEKKQIECSLLGLGANVLPQFERKAFLRSIDQLWRDHLQTMTVVKDAVGWRSYGQQNPLAEYRKEAVGRFQNWNHLLKYFVTYHFFRFPFR